MIIETIKGREKRKKKTGKGKEKRKKRKSYSR